MAKKTSTSQKAHYSNYKTQGIFAKNKQAKLVRHLKKHPDDGQAVRAEGNVTAKSSRFGSKTGGHVGNRTTDQVAKLVRKVANVMATATKTGAMYLGNEVVGKQRLATEFGFTAEATKPAGKKKTTRRGSGKKATK